MYNPRTRVRVRRTLKLLAATVGDMPVTPELARRIRRAAARHNDARQQRDEAIRQAIEDGATLREVAQLAGLSHTAVRKIAGRGS